MGIQGSFAVVLFAFSSAGAPDSDGTLTEIIFAPGKLGIDATWSTGRVDAVHKGGQASELGVEVGMYFFKVDGIAYREDLLDRRIAGTQDYIVTFSSEDPSLENPVPTPTPSKDGAPDKPEFEYATELSPLTFHDKVYKATNGTGAETAYFPLVMFHVSWCKHCKQALPEFEKAAEMLAEYEKSGKLDEHVEAVPRFFLIECDAPANKQVCEPYVGNNFLVIKLFRDGHSILFDRPRLAQTFAWWATHVARPPIMEIAKVEEVNIIRETSPAFILHADKAADSSLAKAWEDVALDFIDTYDFYRVRPKSQAAGVLKLSPPPSVAVWGEGFEALPIEGQMTREVLTSWARLNQFKPVTELAPETAYSLQGSRLVVVTLVYRGDDAGAGLRKDFVRMAKELRRGGEFVFATANVSEISTAKLISRAFPLLSPDLLPPPRVFAFRGDTYWESTSLKTAADVTVESIRSLLADAEAMQDRSVLSYLKEKRKRYVRYAGSSATALAFAVLLPASVLAGCYCCVKALLSADEQTADRIEDQKRKSD